MSGGKFAKQKSKKRNQRRHQRHQSGEKKTLIRKISSKRAEQHLGSPILTPSRSFHPGLSRSLSSGDSLPGSPTHPMSSRSPPMGGRVCSSDSAHSTANSSNSSSPGTSAPNSPATAAAAAAAAHYNRPSSLHGLKHKLQQSIKSPSRRKSVHNIPVSPLARTPSPSPMATSPTRSPSPLTVVQGHGPHAPVLHPLGISNMTQTYNPTQQQTSPSPNQSLSGSGIRRVYPRPRSIAEPGSPLLRRALSPDRLHPSSAEKPKLGLQRKASLQERKVKPKHS